MELQTIAAIATALGESSIGVVRISGPDALRIAHAMVRSPKGGSSSFQERGMRFAHIVHPHSKDVLDEGIVLWMPGPRSYTGEDVLELQIHGGVQLLQNVLSAALAAGAVMAEPGEFTKRAFLNGRIDLSQAEAVMDLIRSKTEYASRVALQQVEGRFGAEVRSLRSMLIELQAHVEVTIDYPEHDVEDVAVEAVLNVGRELVQRVDMLLDSAVLGRVLREGVATAIIGRPNVGKSSLLNALLERDRAIVTDIPGTTRDVLEEFVNVQGIPLKLIDTAGIRETSDIVERMGVERSRQSMQDAELILVVLDGSVEPTMEDTEMAAATAGLRRVVVLNKTDKGLHPKAVEFAGEMASWGTVSISAHSGEGVAQLKELVADVVKREISGEMDTTYMTNARQKRLLELAKEDLISAMDGAAAGATLDLIAVALQSAYEQLGYVIGEETGEDLLDEIFSRFCLGK